MGTNPFEHSTYLLRKQSLKVFDGSFRIYDPMDNLAVFASMKAFKLKEDITLHHSVAAPVIPYRAHGGRVRT